jgi:hypothetical protein
MDLKKDIIKPNKIVVSGTRQRCTLSTLNPCRKNSILDTKISKTPFDSNRANLDLYSRHCTDKEYLEVLRAIFCEDLLAAHIQFFRQL